MKLIIDIPEETYNDIQSRDWKNGELIFSEEWKAIHYGTPLDNLRAEIEQRPYGVANDSVIQGMKYERVAILEIIDKYKAESEE